MLYRELSSQDISALLPKRKPNTHKGNYGRILLLCGSRGYTGAAALAAMGALRIGAGLVYLGVPEDIYAIEAVKLTEPVVFPLESAHWEEDIQKALTGKDAVLIGPGIGRSDQAFQAVQTVLNCFSGPVVLDADGINVCAEHKDILRRRTGCTILTPHEGEFIRMGGCLQNGREAGAAALAAELGGIVLLKGHNTLITDGKVIYRNGTGNPGMAVGGSGDVLSGMIVGLLGQGLPPLEAAACGAWLHGAAADLCAGQIGEYGMLPTDYLEYLPRLLK